MADKDMDDIEDDEEDNDTDDVEDTTPTETPTKRGLTEINIDLSAVEAKAQAGGMTLDQLQALAKEGARLRTEREKVAGEAERGVREEITERLKKVKLSIPKDAVVAVTFKRDGDKLIIQTAAVVSPTLADAVYEAVGIDLLVDAEKVSSIKGITINAEGVSLNAPISTSTKSPTSTSMGGGAQKKPMTVQGVTFESGAAAYKAIFEVDKLPYAMNWDACATKIRNKDGKDSRTVTE